MDQFMDEYIKQSIISTIHLLQDKLGTPQYTFSQLWRCSYENLQSIRDGLLKQYNKSNEA